MVSLGPLMDGIFLPILIKIARLLGLFGFGFGCGMRAWENMHAICASGISSFYDLVFHRAYDYCGVWSIFF